jgi:hypothetical protein
MARAIGGAANQSFFIEQTAAADISLNQDDEWPVAFLLEQRVGPALSVDDEEAVVVAARATGGLCLGMESTCARDLERRLADLVRSERHLVVQFVRAAGFAKRELYRELGYTALFYYCVRQLGLSKSSAFR